MNQVCSGILVLLALHVVHGQIPFHGRCPNVTVQEDFQVADYMGIWYEYEKYPFVFEVGRKCMYAIYNQTSDDTISVMNTAIGRFSGKPTNVTGAAKVIGSGRLSVSFPHTRSANSTKVNYEVLGTDYTSYAVVYSCSTLFKVANSRVLWVLTRERNPPKSVIEKAEAVIDANKLNKTFLMKTSQTGCDAEDDEPPAGDSDEVTTSDPTMENISMENA